MAPLFVLADVRPAYGQGVRGGLVWFIFLTGGILTDQVALGFQAGFMGWVVAFTDDYIGLGRRINGAIAVTLIGATATFIATVAGNWLIWSVVASVGIGFVMGLFGVLGPPGVKKGLVTMFLTLFAVGLPDTVSGAGQLALATIIGGAAGILALLISLPLDTGRSQRIPVKLEMLAISRYADAMAQSVSTERLGEVRGELVAATTNANIDTRYQFLRSNRQHWTIAYFRGLDIARDLTAFHEARVLTQHGETDAMLQMYRVIGIALAEKSEVIGGGSGPIRFVKWPSREAALAAIETVISELSAAPSAQQVGLDAARSLRDSMAALGTVPTEPTARSKPPRMGPDPVDLVRRTLTHDTLLRRHLFRYAVLIGLGTALYKAFDIPEGFFIPIGINIMLQPDMGAGLTRLQVFTLGTVAGSIIGAVVGVALGGWPVAIAFVTAIVWFGLTAYIGVTYWAFAVGVSIAIVAALGLLIPGDWDLAFWRIVSTVIAAVMVLVGLFVLWPTRGAKFIPGDFGRLLKHIAEYLEQSLDLVNMSGLEKARVMLGVELTELIQQMAKYANEPGASPALIERHQDQVRAVRSMMGIVTCLRLGRRDDFSYSTETEQLGREVVSQLRICAIAFEKSGPEVPPTQSSVQPQPESRWADSGSVPTGAGDADIVDIYLLRKLADEIEKVSGYCRCLGKGCLWRAV